MLCKDPLVAHGEKIGRVRIPGASSMLNNVLGNVKNFIDICIFEGWGEAVCTENNYRILQKQLVFRCCFMGLHTTCCRNAGKVRKGDKTRVDCVCVCVCIIWEENKLSFEEALCILPRTSTCCSTQYCNYLLI